MMVAVRASHEGAVLGGAIGDAMGNPTEFLGSMELIRQRYGPRGVEGFVLFWGEGSSQFAPYTDDTQLAEQVLQTLLDSRDQGWDLDRTMEEMAYRFITWSTDPQGGHRGPGMACMSGCARLAAGVPWAEAGGADAGGCGSVMRAWPFGLVFADDLQRAEHWSVEHSKLTHRDPIALAACAAIAVGSGLATREAPVDRIATEMIAAAGRYSSRTAGMMERAVEDARAGVGTEAVLRRLQGWAAHEAIAAALYLFVRNPDDPRAVILEGANSPGDSDSIASIGGALVGARCGLEALPAEWVAQVERSNELLALARRI